MNRGSAIILALCVSASAQAQDGKKPGAAGSPNPAEGIELTEGRYNAALQYYSEWITMRDLIDAKREISEVYKPQAMPEYTGLLEMNQESIQRLIEASALERCDFGLARDRGINAVMPWLGLMRTSAMILIDDAIRLEGLGDIDGAVQRISAVYRMADQASQDGFLIGSLVGVAMANLASEHTAHLLDQGFLTPGHAAVLTKAINALLDEDPFHARAAIVDERDVMSAWVKTNFTGDMAGLRFARLFLDFGPVTEVKQLQGMNGEELAAQIDRARDAYDDLIAAWDAGDPQAEIARIGEQLRADRYGPFAKAMIPGVSRMKASVTKAVSELSQLRHRLEAVT